MLPTDDTAFEALVVFSVKDEATAFALCDKLDDRQNDPHWRLCPCTGQYKGETRPYSFVANAGLYPWLVFNGFLDGQESVLYLHPVTSREGSRKAELVHINGSKLKCPSRPYGKWQEVGEDVAKAQEGWTYRHDTGRYYTCLGIPEERG